MLMRCDMRRFVPSKAIPFLIGVAKHVSFRDNYARFQTAKVKVDLHAVVKKIWLVKK